MEFWQSVAFLETDQLLEVARGAEELGFTGVVVSDHIFFPKEMSSAYPYSADGRPLWSPLTPWPDPWCVISAMAAVTRTLRFTTSVYIAPARDLFTVGKLVATAADLAPGRVSLGVGAGWMAEEFEQLGQDFHTRGRRLDEMIVALRTLWRGGWVEHHGEHYDFGPLQCNPHPERPVPILCGGVSEAALRRAATLCDGWLAEGVRPAPEVIAQVDDLRRRLVEAGRDPEQFVVLTPIGASASLDDHRRLADVGVTGIIASPWLTATGADGVFSSTLATKLDAMKVFSDRYIAHL